MMEILLAIAIVLVGLSLYAMFLRRYIPRAIWWCYNAPLSRKVLVSIPLWPVIVPLLVSAFLVSLPMWWMNPFLGDYKFSTPFEELLKQGF